MTGMDMRYLVLEGLWKGTKAFVTVFAVFVPCYPLFKTGGSLYSFIDGH